MNKTPNYQLNQWEAEDRVLRTDFNADNAKIDAALGAIPAAVLYRGKLTAAAASHTIDLSQKEPERLFMILLWVQLPEGEHNARLRVEGGSNYFTHSNPLNSNMYADSCMAYFTKGPAPSCSRITVGRSINGGPHVLSSFTPQLTFSTSGMSYYSEGHGACSVPSLNNLKFVLVPGDGETTLPAGTEIAAIGFKI